MMKFTENVLFQGYTVDEILNLRDKDGYPVPESTVLRFYMYAASGMARMLVTGEKTETNLPSLIYNHCEKLIKTRKENDSNE